MVSDDWTMVERILEVAERNAGVERRQSVAVNEYKKSCIEARRIEAEAARALETSKRAAGIDRMFSDHITHIECLICGSDVSDMDRHYDWHVEYGTVSYYTAKQMELRIK
jgi:hypothetical protein